MKQPLHWMGRLCLSVCVLCGFWNSAAAQTIFVNEIHYDNSSTDTGEAIEIAGPSGTDLAGYSIVLYNGSNATVYNTVNLTGILPNQSGGYGTAFVSIAGIQNGAPDGLALVSPDNEVLQFLSYEGSFVASEGPAAGLNSTDIGIAESSSTPVGSALFLTGEGTDYSDFTWSSGNASFGAVNEGQSFGLPAVVINEFVFNHTGSDSNEFVEILASSNQDLSSYSLLEIEGDGTGSGTIDEVIALTAADASGYWSTVYGANVFENGTVTLLLVKDFTGALGDDLDTDNDGSLDSTPWSEIADGIGVQDGGTEDRNYSALVLLKDFDGSTFTVGGASRIPNGTNTGSANDWVRNSFNGAGLPDFPGANANNGEALNTKGAENEVFVENTMELIINEIDADTESSDVLEFIELYDGGVGNAALDGYVVVLFNGNGDASYNAIDLTGQTSNEAGYFVIGNAGVENVDIVINTNGLQNGADAVGLYQGSAADFPNGTPVTEVNLIDAVVYDTNDADDQELLVLLNADQPQLNEDANGNKDAHSLQRYVNGSGGSRNTSSYVAALPTPGRQNSNATEPVNLIINEVDSDTDGTDVLEFVELYDGGVGNTALDGHILVLFNGNGDASYNTVDLAGNATNEEGYFVVGNAAVANVGLVLPSNALQNGADAVALYQAPAVDFPNGTAVTTVNLIDALVYDTDDVDDIGLLVLMNAGQAQVNENENGEKTSQSLQRIENGTGGVRNSVSYQALSPTPGTSNGTTTGGGTLMTIAEARAQLEGTEVIVTGTLTASDQFGGPSFVQDATGGIAVFDSQLHGDGLFQIGDSVTISAVRASFSEQVQLSSISALTNHGPATIAIEPKAVTLQTMGDYAGQLVYVTDVAFPQPNDLIFGNSNYTLTDASGQGQLRIDNSVSALIGLAQPVSCDSLTGVVGRFLSSYQLLPRRQEDMPCASKFEPGNGNTTDPALTLDLTTWNIEWFGDEGNGPGTDAVQKDSVKTILSALNADVISVQEITDVALFDQMISELDGYAYILSDAVSYPAGGGAQQRVGFIYKTATVTPDLTRTKPLLASIHPYYNGGDGSALVGYPESDVSRFYASGRLPFLMVAEVSINGASKEIHFVALHARANSSNGPQSRYDMRKYDVEVLKDTLDTQYANANLAIMGDFNDDLDETVADVTATESTYEAYVLDTDRYFAPTLTLSEAGFRSYAFRENMIDHIVLSNELQPDYLDSTATVGYQFYDADYTETVSDHFPVTIRVRMEVQENNFYGSKVVSFTQGKKRNGRKIHSKRSNAEKSIGMPYENRYYNFVSLGFGGEIVLELSDYARDLPGDDIVVYESTFGRFTVPCRYYPEKAEVFASEDGEVFYSLGTTCQNGMFDLQVSGLNQAKYIKIKDISNKRNFWWHADGYDVDAVTSNPLQGDANAKGTIEFEENMVPNEEQEIAIAFYPNPVSEQLTVEFVSEETEQLQLRIYDRIGKQALVKQLPVNKGVNVLQVPVGDLPKGMYILKIDADSGFELVSESIIIE